MPAFSVVSLRSRLKHPVRDASLVSIVSMASERLVDAFQWLCRGVLRDAIEECLGLFCAQRRRKRNHHAGGDDRCRWLAMPENENALISMLGGVDELGQMGFRVGER